MPHTLTPFKVVVFVGQFFLRKSERFFRPSLACVYTTTRSCAHSCPTPLYIRYTCFPTTLPVATFSSPNSTVLYPIGTHTPTYIHHLTFSCVAHITYFTLSPLPHACSSHCSYLHPITLISLLNSYYLNPSSLFIPPYQN